MHYLVFLAKLAVETYTKEGKVIEVPEDLSRELSRADITDLLKKRAGTFVTIEKGGQLRGCVGTYLPTRINIAEEIVRNAVAAASEDYRFGQLQKEELSNLSYTVYVLSEPEPVKNIKELDPKTFGIIVKTGPFTYPSGSQKDKRGQDSFDHPNQKDVVVDEASPHLPPHLSLEEGSAFNGVVPYKTGLLLPDLKEIDNAEQQLAIACQKGGINPEKEKIFIYRFTAEKYQ